MGITAKNRKRVLTAALLVAAITAYVAVRFQMSVPEPIAAARLALLKVNGTAPEVAWNQVVRVLTGFERWPHFASELVKGDVTLIRRSNSNACPYVYKTHHGEIHGRFQDGELLEGLLKQHLVDKVYETDQAHVGKGDVVLDVGGHLGTFAQYAFHRGASRVIAFEPEPGNVTCLKQTFSREIQEGKYVLVDAAVSESNGRITLYQHPNSSMNRTLENGITPGLQGSEKNVFKRWETVNAHESTVVVDTVTIDDTLRRLKVEKLDFIKMDIEGAERHALVGARSTLQRFGPRLVLGTDHLVDDAKVLPEIILKTRPSYRTFYKNTEIFFF